MIDLTGKVILVTGASSGIGRQCAITLSRLGAAVGLFGRNLSRLEETLALCARPEKHYSISLELTNYDAIESAVSECVSNLGRISGLICAAGISTTRPLSSLKPEQMVNLLAANTVAPMIFTKFASRRANFAAEGGSIVLLSSVMSLAGEKGKSLYSASKGALVSASRSLALELASRQIRVNSVSPGVVLTPMVENAVYSQTAEAFEWIQALHPLGFGSPDDVANVCAFLVSDAARWITGTNIVVDGGYCAQ